RPLSRPSHRPPSRRLPQARLPDLQLKNGKTPRLPRGSFHGPSLAKLPSVISFQFSRPAQGRTQCVSALASDRALGAWSTQVISAIFSWLESRTDSFPPEKPAKPGSTLWGFVWHYSRPFSALILTASALAMAIAIIEVYLFAFLGRLVDWL